MQNFQELTESYLAGIDHLRQAVAGMSPTALSARPIPDKWTTLECVAHIADFEPVFAERMKRVLSHVRPLLFEADENLFAATLSYADRDINEELAIVEVTRKQMARILKRVSKEGTSRVGIHTFKGLVTLEAILASAVNHLPGHLKHIAEKRQALGL